MFVRLQISLLRIKLAASNFARPFIGVLGSESPILGNFAPQGNQNRPANRPARALNYKQNWKEPRLACRPRLTEVKVTFYL